MVQQGERNYIKQFVKGNSLDIGCGKHKIGGFGIDCDKDSDADLICDMSEIPLRDETYDYIISCHCLEHTVHTIKCLKEWYRLLKVGGKLILAVPNGEHTNNTDLGDSSYGHVQLFSEKTLSNFLEFVGFKINKSTYFNKEESTDKTSWSIIIITEK